MLLPSSQTDLGLAAVSSYHHQRHRHRHRHRLRQVKEQGRNDEGSPQDSRRLLLQLLLAMGFLDCLLRSALGMDCEPAPAADALHCHLTAMVTVTICCPVRPPRKVTECWR
eukprot:COSAG06_NODE_34633_length_471_cov_7.817204_2_plen_110_part_01